MNSYRDVLTVLELTILVLVLLAPGFARGLAQLLVIHANALDAACRAYRLTWNRSSAHTGGQGQRPKPNRPRSINLALSGKHFSAGIADKVS